MPASGRRHVRHWQRSATNVGIQKSLQVVEQHDLRTAYEISTVRELLLSMVGLRKCQANCASSPGSAQFADADGDAEHMYRSTLLCSTAGGQRRGRLQVADAQYSALIRATHANRSANTHAHTYVQAAVGAQKVQHLAYRWVQACR